MSKKINWGILGAGKIAGKFARDLATLPDANLYAVGSRNLAKAESFAEELGFQKAYGSYEQLLQDLDLQIVYIATPHVFHCENTLLCLQHKKAVLCEKPFAINSSEVQKMIALSQDKNIFLMDALWTLYLPHILKTKAIVESGELGALVSVRADFGFRADFSPESRLFDLNLGGGSLLDIGIYPALLSLFLLGKPQKVTAAAKIGTTGIDEECAVFLEYASGQTANLHSSLLARTPTEAYIYCEKGYIHIPTRFHERVDKVTILTYENLEETVIPFDYQVTGYAYEAAEAMKCLKAGAIESNLVPHQFSLDLMGLLDEIRRQIGLVYPKHD
ncbi:MAG: Gfo/Idh/MocA family oxidoreductase [Bacteroidota bacterium]